MEIATPEDGNATPMMGGADIGKSRALSPDDRRLLAEAIARGEREVVLQIVAAPGQSGQVVSEIEKLGGVIRSHHEDLDYLSASVPTDKVESVAQLTSVQTVSLSDELPIPDPRP
jgi:hypothetical protein